MATTLADARAEGAAGAQRALDHAESKVSAWGEQALAYLKAYAERRERFPGWFVTNEAELSGQVSAPPTRKAWGSVFTKAARLGYIVRTGYRPDPNRHAAPCPEWTSRIYKAA